MKLFVTCPTLLTCNILLLLLFKYQIKKNLNTISLAEKIFLNYWLLSYPQRLILSFKGILFEPSISSLASGPFTPVNTSPCLKRKSNPIQSSTSSVLSAHDLISQKNNFCSVFLGLNFKHKIKQIGGRGLRYRVLRRFTR